MGHERRKGRIERESRNARGRRPLAGSTLSLQHSVLGRSVEISGVYRVLAHRLKQTRATCGACTMNGSTGGVLGNWQSWR